MNGPRELKDTPFEPLPAIGEIRGTLRWDADLGSPTPGLAPTAAVQVTVNRRVAPPGLGDLGGTWEPAGLPSLTGADLEPDGGFVTYTVTDLPLDDPLQVQADLISGMWTADVETLQFVLNGTDQTRGGITLSVEDSAATFDFELTLVDGD